MNIGEASKASGVSAKMIRYYKSIGLLPRADRRESGYRDYGSNDVHRLAFVRRAREFGFSIDSIGELLSLWADQNRSHVEVRKIAMHHVTELKAQASRLQEMIATLQKLVTCCKRGDRPECPIMTELGGVASQASGPTRAPRPRNGVRL